MNPLTPEPQAVAIPKPGLYIGTIILSAFGAYYLFRWCSLSFPNPTPFQIGIGFLTVALITVGAIGLKKSRSQNVGNAQAEKSKWRKFYLVLAIEMFAIFFSTRILMQTGHAEWITDAIVLIVGLHFFPLAPILRHKTYFATGAALTVIAIAIPMIRKEGPSSPLLPFLAGMVLWATAAHSFWRTRAFLK